MDEPTSALDADSEKLVQRALESLFQERTCIIVSHRLDVIKNCNMILVLDKGKLIEQGSHSQLMEVGGVYANLFNSSF